MHFFHLSKCVNLPSIPNFIQDPIKLKKYQTLAIIKFTDVSDRLKT